MTFTCGQCKRSFADAARLAQHKADAHGSGMAKKKKPAQQQQQPAQKPAANKRKKRGGGGSGASGSGMGRLLDRGVDLLTAVSVPAYNVVGQRLFNIEITPTNFTGRLAQECTLWERWRPQSLRVEIVASGSSTTFGSMVVGWSADESLNLGQGADSTSRVLALRPSAIIRANQTHTLTLPMDTLTKWYQVHDSQHNSHGCIAGVVMNRFGGFSGSFGVSVVVHWTIMFEGVALPTANQTDGYISCDSEWQGYDLFTTSDSSFSTTILTFKAHSGGAMVTFSAARPGVVYKGHAEQKVFYVDSTGTEKTCEYFVVLSHEMHAQPGFVLFESKEKAFEFVKTGSMSIPLVYKSAGKFCKPQLLKFKAEAYASDPNHEVEDLKRRVELLSAQLHGLMAEKRRSVRDDAATSDNTFRDLAAGSSVDDIKSDLISRPKGTTVDPIKCLVEDPIFPLKVKKGSCDLNASGGAIKKAPPRKGSADCVLCKGTGKVHSKEPSGVCICSCVTDSK